jgi:hypothetical protein
MGGMSMRVKKSLRKFSKNYMNIFLTLGDIPPFPPFQLKMRNYQVQKKMI